MQSATRRAAASLRIARARALRPPLRSIATAAAAPSIRDLLHSATADSPLKDAVKFMGYANENATVWTYSQLASHVSALSTGLSHLNYSQNDAILTLLPADSPEYTVLLLAASQLGISIIPLPTPADPQTVDVDALKAALNEHRPAALVIHSSCSVPEHADSSRILAASNSVVNALDPSIALNDAAGLLGFVPLTGRPFYSAQFPFLRHIVSTDDVNARGTITLRSLLVYSGESPYTASEAPLLITSAGQASQSQLIADAEKLCTKMSISSDPLAKEGKLVTKPALSTTSATSLVASIMKHALWVTSADRDKTEVAASENALVV
ncbi:hypothetical protein BWQ96_02660 [Gracilariopsis chorda]|uniref:AMP-dependent synthetase/ligase domain-containing protein n=1 Tax=Gracilariopsis chorda TaxID=448386 RepID=A0A2V3IZD1_9FLOR|nr:hypothetical protein BWQ96_02660 [Gracilariopsis chorda]|eukprot:PXF47516.1 hypothetical protein BWQ96_02660 [Gracilariopsis chorda]